ncbi:hypothetical protein MUS1_11900 [Marinomonas ushuaiensis DSM 15871]|uniref:Outer membrane protein beta-barrel domain-containing protein n=1 Tax=Marinomonas ushuaiensis DSM 15871 TaxID=1122207 RepID=X7E544_9GAMM|nr:hypothetical protein [Marinomonas ushuaiensis]ETX11072.1 hypothetical protein MUS1_11900 [Marinomonas ushuaiensis DSM 15871]
MTVFPCVYISFSAVMTTALMTVSGSLYAVEENPNFAVGLGYGLLNEKSLMNLDFKINIPINQYLSTQILLNSNYLVTGSAISSFAQSEFSSNWFVRNEFGRLGFGLGISEIEPMDESLDSDREVTAQLMGEMFLDSFTLTTNYISNESTLSNITSSRVGVSYYLDNDQRISLYQEKYNDQEVGWRLETYFQPKKYDQMGSVGVIARSSDDYDYLGVIVQYYFDYAVSLKRREREYN